MNLDRCTATEHDDHFLVDTGDGRKPLRIAKGAIGADLHEKIRAMCHGGVVKMAEGGEVGDPTDAGALPAEDAPLVSLTQPTASEIARDASLGPSAFDALAGAIAPPPVEQPTIAGEPPIPAASLTDRARAALASGLRSPVGGVLVGPAAVPLANAIEPKGPVTPDDVPLTGGPAKGPVPEFKPDGARSALPPVESFMPAAPSPATPGIGIPSIATPKLKKGEVPPELAAAQQAQADATRKVGEVEAAQKAAEAQAQDQIARQREALAAESAQRLKDAQARADSLREQVLKSEIDPRRLMGSMSTGQKVTAVIGMLLGGIGAGLTRGPNYAAEALNKAIEQDIDAQRSQKQSLMAMYQQAGHDVDVARELARADLRDVAAAQIARAAAQFGSDKQRAQTEALVADLQKQAIGERQAAMARDFDQKNRPLLAQQELQKNAIEMAARKQEMGLRAAAFGQAAQGTQAQAAAQRVESVLAQGGAVPREVLPLVGKDTRERLVQRPDGAFEAAYDPDSAKKMREVNQAAGEMRTAIAEMRDLRRRNSGGKILSDADAARAKQLVRQTEIAVNKMGGLGALDAGTQEILAQIIPDPLAFFTTDAKVNAQLDGLQRGVESRVASARGAYLLPPPSQPLTTRKPGA